MHTMITNRSVARERLMVVGSTLLMALISPVAGWAQGGQSTIDPGMTQQEVISRLGAPDEESVSGSYSYMYYDNDCGKRCGMDDLVVLERGIVVDAIFRSKARTFTGVSSSPHDLAPVPAAHFAPEPLRMATHDDSAHAGGIVFAEPRAELQPPKYIHIVPNHADSARMVSKSDTAAPH